MNNIPSVVNVPSKIFKRYDKDNLSFSEFKIELMLSSLSSFVPNISSGVSDIFYSVLMMSTASIFST
jgi:hypothetical protein